MISETFIKAFPFAKDMQKEHLEEFLNSSIVSKPNAKDIILDVTKACSGIGFIVSGNIRFYRLSEDGREITLYHVLSGQMCLLTATCFLGKGYIDYPIGAVAECDSTIVFLPFDLFGRLFGKSDALQKFLFSSMSERLFNIMDVVGTVAFRSVSSRLAEFLIKNSNMAKHPIYSTHFEIANEIGSAREVVSRLLKSMENDGVLKLGRGRIDILKFEDLKKLSKI